MEKKILYLDSETKYCNYYSDIVMYLKKYSNLKHVICRNDSSQVYEEIKLFNPDLLLLGFSITDTGGKCPKFELNNIEIPIYIILNKEYDAIEKKLEWIKKIKPTKVFTVHHKEILYQTITNIPFIKIMWSANELIFKQYNDIYKYDLFFSGVIRDEQNNNIRNKIYDNLHFINKYKILIKVAFFKNNKLSGKLNTFNLNDYAMNINLSKIALTTTGPADLVGTRYFEIMASNKALIMCNRMSQHIYQDIVIDKFNCIMFDDENDFIKKFIYYINNEQERMQIVQNAYKYFLEKHTWHHKVKHLLNNL